MAATTTLAFAGVNVGDQLPEEIIELTPTLIIASAIATRDFQDVHHDYGLAQERGMPNIFMNILSTNGLVGRFVTDWAGPKATVADFGVRFSSPVVVPDDDVGAAITVSGQVEGKLDGNRVALALTARSAETKVLTRARAVVRLP